MLAKGRGRWAVSQKPTYTDAALIRLPCLQGVLPADVVEDGELSSNYQEPY